MSNYDVIVIFLLGFLFVLQIIPLVWKALLFLFQKTKFNKLGKSSQLRVVRQIASAVEILSKSKIGAIITIINKKSIDNFRTDGVEINANISSQLIISIFQKSSPLHDGALIIDNDKIIYAGTFYKLTNKSIDLKYGARHRAAIGISEKSDSLTIVTSEESGLISFVKDGRVFKVKKQDLQGKIIQYLK